MLGRIINFILIMGSCALMTIIPVGIMHLMTAEHTWYVLLAGAIVLIISSFFIFLIALAVCMYVVDYDDNKF